MARLLSRPNRARRFDAINGIISNRSSTFLALGRGIGALIEYLTQKFSSSLIVDADRSERLLRARKRE